VQIKISVRHNGRLNDDVQQFIRDKANKLTHIFERLTLIEVTVDLSRKEEKLVEFVVQAEHKHDFVGRESHAELLTAVETALHRVEAQLRRYKEKIQDHHRRLPPTEKAGGGPAEEAAGE
jgi:putative sigma-54 modulation protein